MPASNSFQRSGESLFLISKYRQRPLMNFVLDVVFLSRMGVYLYIVLESSRAGAMIEKVLISVNCLS